MKIDLWEGGHRIPFVAQWPGKIPAGTVRNDLFCFTDLMATFAAITGDTLPENAGQDSNNMLPVFMNEALPQPIRNELITQERTIRVGDWKLIQGNALGILSKNFGNVPAENENWGGELYNLAEDLSEAHNLYGENPDKVDELTKRLKIYPFYEAASPLP
jgi:arylsulfatase A-like enzyme